MITRSFGGPLLVWYDAEPGTCEVVDTRLPREQQRCPQPVTCAAWFTEYDGTESWAYACARHGAPLAQQAAGAVYITGEVRPLRR